MMADSATGPYNLDKAASWLREKVGYEFNDKSLLAQALTHRSAAGPNNERLEFLGDAILDVVISEVVYRQRPDASEGVMSRIRSSLVKDASLAKLATTLGVSDYLILGPGEKRAGGHHRLSILADALEALFGAVYLDSHFLEARRVIHAVYGNMLVSLPESAARRDPKTRLQELLQARKIDLPAYVVERITGKAHRQTFEVRCTVEAIGATALGRGSSRRQAEQEAAAIMLEQLGGEAE